MTIGGYKEACKLQSLKSKSLNSVTCADVPRDFLFKVSDKVMKRNPENIIISQHIRDGYPYPTSEAVDNLVCFLSKHIKSITNLRLCESINVLILCCEQPVLAVDILLRLCTKCSGFAKSFNFLVVDKDKEVQEIGSAILGNIPA